MTRRRTWLAAVTLVVISFGVTGCRVGNNGRTATVAEPSSNTVEADVANDEPVSRPSATITSANSPTASTSPVEPAESTRPLSEQEIADLERQLEEIDRLLTDAERALDD